jgi:hypothetical protein
MLAAFGRHRHAHISRGYDVEPRDCGADDVRWLCPYEEQYVKHCPQHADQRNRKKAGSADPHERRRLIDAESRFRFAKSLPTEKHSGARSSHFVPITC